VRGLQAGPQREFAAVGPPEFAPVTEIEGELYEAWEYLQETGQPAQVFRDFEYQTLESWSRPRRVIGKAEQLPAGPNPRYIVTSLAIDETET
jgi:hypothetical protein